MRSLRWITAIGFIVAVVCCSWHSVVAHRGELTHPDSLLGLYVGSPQDDSDHESPQPLDRDPTLGSLQTEKEIQRTLNSVRKVGEHPLYVMTYFGDYDVEVGTRLASSNIDVNRWGCSLFAALGDSGSPVYGRNFDWFHHPALLLFADPDGGYASVSMVDISYLGYDRKDLKPLDSIQGRRALLQAPFLPFDGMNEHGLTVGMAAVSDTSVPNDPNKPTVHSVGVIRLMLDRARTVDEALEVFSRYNIDFVGGPNIHYLIADPQGNSALIEIKNGKTHIIRGSSNWQSATNFYLTGNEETACEQCMRYSKIHDRMTDLKGNIDPDAAMKLLRNVSQRNTQWSVVYQMATGEVEIAMARRYNTPHQFKLKSESSKEGPQ